MTKPLTAIARSRIERSPKTALVPPPVSLRDPAPIPYRQLIAERVQLVRDLELTKHLSQYDPNLVDAVQTSLRWEIGALREFVRAA